MNCSSDNQTMYLEFYLQYYFISNKIGLCKSYTVMFWLYYRKSFLLFLKFYYYMKWYIVEGIHAIGVYKVTRKNKYKIFLVSSQICCYRNSGIRHSCYHFSVLFSKRFESNTSCRLSPGKHKVLDCHYQFNTGSLGILYM